MIYFSSTSLPQGERRLLKVEKDRCYHLEQDLKPNKWPGMFVGSKAEQLEGLQESRQFQQSNLSPESFPGNLV